MKSSLPRAPGCALPLMLSWRRTAAFVLLSLACWTGAAMAQTSTGNLRGYVTNPSNAPIQGATVTARLIENGQTRSVTTNSDGFYYLGGLRPGRYDVNVRRLGFAPESRTVAVPIGVTVDARIAMRESVAQPSSGAVQLSTVVVRGSNATSMMTSEVGANISREQIANLPNYERNVLDLARLAPGITAQKVDDRGKTLAAGGQPAEAVNIFIDGASYKSDVLKGGVVGQDASKGNPFPQGAIQEFRVQTQNFKAEYQKAASAVITATTRTGGNQTEADLFMFGVGHGYTARDALTVKNAGGAPQYQRLQAGGNIGGPIVRDKLFYFGTYELNFRDEPAYIRLGSDTLLAPTALRQQLLAYTGQQAQQFREHLGFGKITWLASPRSTADFSLNIRRDDDFKNFGGTTAFEASENLRVSVYTGVASWKYAGDRFLNEAQISAQSSTWNPTGTNFDLIGKDYVNLLRIGGKDAEQNFTQGRISLRDDITRGGVQLGGDHVFKVGTSLDFLSYDATKAQNGNPLFRYRSNEAYARPYEAVFGFGDQSIAANNTQFGLYAQDDWTVTKRLTLNLGIRWDVETNMINNGYVTPQSLADSLRGPLNGMLYVDQPLVSGSQQVRVVDELGGLDRFISNGRSSRPAYMKAFQPRFGFSYDVTGDARTVVFGGAGLYFDRNYWNTLLDEQFRRQYQVLNVSFQDACPPGSAANCVVWDPKYYDPAQLRTLAGSKGVPEVFLVANDLVPPRSIQMSFGVRQAIGDAQLSVSYAGVRGSHYMNWVHGAPWNSLGPNYSTLWVTDDRVKTWYDALQMQLDRPLRPGTRWGGGLAYTFGKAREQGQTTDLFWGFDDHYPTVADRPILATPGDQRHSVSANAIVRLPYGLLFSTITTLGSGVTAIATDASNGWAYGQQRTYTFTPPGTALLGIGPKFDTKNVDVRLEKGLTIQGGQRISLLADVFNALGSSNYGCYNATINPTTEAPNANFGTPTCAGLGRRLQVGVRYGYHPATTEQ